MSQSQPQDALTAKVLDYIGLGFLLTPPDVLVVQGAMSSHPNWPLIVAIAVGCWTVGSIILAVGLQWPKIKPYLSAGLARSITAAANSAAVWLVMAILFAIGPAVAASYFSANNQESSPTSFLIGIVIVIGVGAIFFFLRGRKRPESPTPSPGLIANAEVLPASWIDRIYIAKMAGENALFSLRNDNSIEFSVILYNANPFGIEISDLVGAISCKQTATGGGAPTYLPPTQLEHPTIRADSKQIPGFSEGGFAIFIHAPKAKADMLIRALDHTGGVEFDFAALTLTVRQISNDETKPLKIWDGIRVRRTSHRTERIISAVGAA